MTSLSERAVLSVLHIGAYSGVAVDREVTEDTAARYKADALDSGTYTKRLVAKAFIDPVRKSAGLATRTHKVLTLPWEDRGPRILANTGFQYYTEQMRIRRLDYEAKAKEFAHRWDDAVKEAKSRLSGMFKPEDYDTGAEVLQRFYLDVEIKGIPEAADFRAKLSDGAVKAIVKDIERRADQRLEAAMNDVFHRVLDVTGHMVERLKNYQPPTGKAKGEKGVNFQDSTVYNIKELADILPALNLTNDKRLDELQQRLLADLVEHSPEILKANPKIRSETARKAEKIHNKVKSFLA